MRKIKKALISVSDKSNLKSVLKILRKNKIEIISSGGTYKEIIKLGFHCLEVSEYTGFPEIMDGRVKTLHPKIHGGILSKRNDKIHDKDCEENGISLIDIVDILSVCINDQIVNGSSLPIPQQWLPFQSFCFLHEDVVFFPKTLLSSSRRPCRLLPEDLVVFFRK